MSASLFDLSGRKALVTGGSKGIGEAIAAGFVRAGADVMVAARSEEPLRAAAARMAAAGPGRVTCRVTDMTRRGEVDALADAAIDELGQVDILVNNAGSNTPQTLDELDDATWDRLVELNFTSALRLTRRLAPAMAERGWGRVIYIASILGSAGAAARSAYCGTKAAVIGMSRAQAIELGPRGVTVNCISPGPILTDLPRATFSAAQRETFAGGTALGRWGEAAELAGPALLLASEAGSYVTGADLVVDGGALIKVM